MGGKSVLDLDDIDTQIIQILQKDPNITHSKIAEMLNRSQPTIGLRIKKLEKKGFISHQFGMNIKKLKSFNVVKLQLRHRDPDFVFGLPERCPFIVNCFRQSGKYNLMLILVCPNLRKIDEIIDHNFRNKGHLCDLEMELLTDFCDDYILPIDIRSILEGIDQIHCNDNTCPCFKKDNGKIGDIKKISN